MTAPTRRASIAILLAAALATGAVVVGGVAGQTATETPNATATTTPPGTADGTPPVPPVGGAGTPTAAGPMTGPGPATGTPPVGGPGTPAGTVRADGTTHEQDVAFLRVAHASPDAGPVDVYVDGEPTLSDVAFGEVSDYLTLRDDEHDVTIAPAGANRSAGFTGTVDLAARSASTLFAAGEVGPNATEPFDPVRYPDDAFRPAANESAVSVSHMSPDAPPVDVTADGGSVVIAENISYREASEYASLPAGTHTIELRQTASSNDGPIVATANVTLEGGTAYSAVAVGYAGADGTGAREPFRVVLAEDATKAVFLPAANVSAGPTAGPGAGGTPGGGAGSPTASGPGTGAGPGGPTGTGPGAGTPTPTPAGPGAGTGTPTPVATTAEPGGSTGEGTATEATPANT